MSCKGCKKTKAVIQEIQTEIEKTNAFQLKDKISLSELASMNPILKAEPVTDEIWNAFLNENPNRISLFKSYPTDWRNNMSETMSKG